MVSDMVSTSSLPRTSRSEAARHRRAALAEQILTAAEDFLRTHPVSGLTIDELMAATGLARTNFYRLFEGREDLLLQVLARANRRLDELTAAWTEGDGPVADDLAVAMRGLVAAYRRSGHVLRAFGEGAGLEPRLRDAWSATLDHFIEMGRDRIEGERRAGRSRVLDAEATARALVLMTEAFMRHEVGAGTLDEDRVVDALLPIWVGAVRGAALVDDQNAV